MTKISKKERIAQIEKQLASLKEEYQSKKAEWESQLIKLLIQRQLVNVILRIGNRRVLGYR